MTYWTQDVKYDLRLTFIIHKELRINHEEKTAGTGQKLSFKRKSTK